MQKNLKFLGENMGDYCFDPGTGNTIFFFFFKQILSLFFIILFWLHWAAHGILVPRPGIKPMLPADDEQSLNQWTAREVPRNTIY